MRLNHPMSLPGHAYPLRSQSRGSIAHVGEGSFRRFVVVGVWIEYEDGHVMALKPVTGGRR
jgi:hypothetical protein